MRTLSRNMPPVPKAPWTLGTYVAFGVLAVLGVGVLYLLTVHVAAWIILGGLFLVGFILNRKHHRHLRHMAAERSGEDLCSFVRAFDRRVADPWVLRAVYEELQPYCTFPGGVLPLRPSDRLEKDLKIDGEELDYLALDIARRCWRSMENSERNPFYSRVQTVHDLVSFFSHQPSLLRSAA